MTPPVAVVIPVWDSYVGFLPEAVASVLDQRIDAELIVVDNASAEQLPPIEGVRVVRSDTRLSTGAARNLGLQAVTAPLVVFLDADDLMLPGSLATLTAGLRDGDIAFAMSRIEGDTGLRHRAPRRIAYVLARAPRLFALANTIWSLVPMQGATILRTADVRATGGYGDHSAGEEDWAFSAALAWRGGFRLTRETGLVYRWRFDSPGQPGAELDVRRNARLVRERLAADPGVPVVARRLLPVVGAAQWLLIALVRPFVRGLRRGN
jgi:glycosyltransferase involved in cell wall biosynthesis